MKNGMTVLCDSCRRQSPLGTTCTSNGDVVWDENGCNLFTGRNSMSLEQMVKALWADGYKAGREKALETN